VTSLRRVPHTTNGATAERSSLLSEAANSFHQRYDASREGDCDTCADLERIRSAGEKVHRTRFRARSVPLRIVRRVTTSPERAELCSCASIRVVKNYSLLQGEQARPLQQLLRSLVGTRREPGSAVERDELVMIAYEQLFAITAALPACGIVSPPNGTSPISSAADPPLRRTGLALTLCVFEASRLITVAT